MKQQNRLKQNDIIQVFNPMRPIEDSFFRVISVEGNRAKTKFRVFNRKIWGDGCVYEYGKRDSPIYNNTYRIVSADDVGDYDVQ
jgi:hypothetical protein